ncbi:MAG: hypothetical protein ACI37J_06110 [Candidatus Bruticola sp.]
MSNVKYENHNGINFDGAGIADNVVIRHKTDKRIRDRLLTKCYLPTFMVGLSVLIPVCLLCSLYDCPFVYLLLLFVALVAIGVMVILRCHWLNPDFDCAITISSEGLSISKMSGNRHSAKPLIYPFFVTPLMKWDKFCYYRANPINEEIFLIKFLRQPVPFYEIVNCCESNEIAVTIALSENETNELLEAIGSKLPFYDIERDMLIGVTDEASEDLTGDAIAEIVQTQEDIQDEPPSRPRTAISRGPIDTSHSRHLRRGESINLSSYAPSTNRRNTRNDSGSNFDHSSQINKLEQY